MNNKLGVPLINVTTGAFCGNETERENFSNTTTAKGGKWTRNVKLIFGEIFLGRAVRVALNGRGVLLTQVARLRVGTAVNGRRRFLDGAR